MPIHLDDRLLEAPSQILGAVLNHAQQTLAATGRIVVEVQVDGESLSGEAIEKRIDESLQDKTVRLESASPADVAADALTGVRDQLGEARVLQAEAADLLQRDQPAEALQKVSQAIQAWLDTQQAVLQSATVLGIDLETFQAQGQELSETVDHLAAQLRELRELITGGDMIGLADALAYEWPGINDQWDGLLNALLEKAKS